MDVETYFHGIAKAYPVLIPYVGFIYSLLRSNGFGFSLAALSGLSDILNMLLKRFNQWLHETSGKDTTNIQRPTEDHPQKQGCDLFSLCQAIEGVNTIGMPSGHAQTTTAMTLLLILIILGQQSNLAWKVFGPLALFGMAIWVMVSRVLIKCHTPNQVLVGSLIGYFLGLGYYYLMRWAYPEEAGELEEGWHYAIWIVPLVIYLFLAILLNWTAI